MLEPMHVLLQEAKKGHYGIPAPNVFSRFTMEACLQAADEMNAPVILGCPGVFGIEEMGELARFYERRYPNVPFALNLDHGGPFEHLIRAIRAGFSSVMVDRSTLPYEQNVAESKEIVKIAHAVGVSVEAELGHVGQGNEYEETRDAGLTHPDEAASFVEETGVDCVPMALAGVTAARHETVYANGDRCQYLDLLFCCRLREGGAAVPRVSDDESLEVGWFSPDDPPAPLAASTVERMGIIRRFRAGADAGDARALFRCTEAEEAR